MKVHNNVALGKYPLQMFTAFVYLVPKKERNTETELFP